MVRMPVAFYRTPVIGRWWWQQTVSTSSTLRCCAQGGSTARLSSHTPPSHLAWILWAFTRARWTFCAASTSRSSRKRCQARPERSARSVCLCNGCLLSLQWVVWRGSYLRSRLQLLFTGWTLFLLLLGVCWCRRCAQRPVCSRWGNDASTWHKKTSRCRLRRSWRRIATWTCLSGSCGSRF